MHAQTGPVIFVVVTADDPVVVVDSIVVVGCGITVVVVVAIGAQKQHPSESVSIFIPAAHLLIVQYGAQCICPFKHSHRVHSPFSTIDPDSTGIALSSIHEHS
jgi:hypothetical protein